MTFVYFEQIVGCPKIKEYTLYDRDMTLRLHCNRFGVDWSKKKKNTKQWQLIVWPPIFSWTSVFWTNQPYDWPIFFGRGHETQTRLKVFPFNETQKQSYLSKMNSALDHYEIVKGNFFNAKNPEFDAILSKIPVLV